MSHNIKPGVATGKEVQEIFKLAKEKGFALPAVNVVGSNTINGALETARDLNAPIIDPETFLITTNGPDLYISFPFRSNI